MEAKDIIIGLLLFGLFATSLFSFASSLYTELEVPLDAEANSSIAKLYAASNASQSQLFKLSDDMQASSPGGKDATSSSSDTSFLGKVLQTGYSIIMLIPNTIKITTNLIGVFATELHIPPVFLTTLLSIISVTVILMIAGALMGSRVLR